MRSLIPLLSLLAAVITPTAGQIDCAFDDDECNILSLIQEDIDSFVPLDTLLNIDSANVTEEEDEPTWECDLRAWTRAPDLSPGAVIPAEARLAVNGSACGDVVKWEVGLRFKERAIIKRKRLDVDYPVQPKRAPWNASREEERNWNDVFTPTIYWSSGQDREYEEAMTEYNRLMSDQELWEVKGHERVVFDIKKELPLDLDNIMDLDVIESFAIHVPLTNFPPMEDFYTMFGTSMGKDEQMLGTENLSEHYHSIHLANGTILDIPSGRSGFVPFSAPVAPPFSIKDSVIQAKVNWPIEVSFSSTKRERDPVDDPDSVPWFDPRIAPECDKGNSANFTLLISSNITQPTIGHNVTFNMTLIRTGNGSEYPAYIDMYHSTDRNVTYAWDFVTSEDDYWSLVSSSADRNEVHYSSTAQKMLVTPTMEALENERKCREDQANGPMMTHISGGIRGIFPMSRDGARYEFWNDDGLVEQDVFEFGVELPMHYRDFPSFEKTFETIRSQLQFTLHTAFACDLRPAHEDEATADEGKEVKLDDEWRDYELPLRKKKKWGTGGLNRAIQKRATAPFDARLPLASEEETTQAVHYLDPTALGPVIADTVTENVNFPLLNQEKREEDKEERVKRRKWDDNSLARSGGWCKPDKKTRNGRWGNAAPSRCWELNGGGGSRHAGRMWQAREARLEGKEVGRRESIGGMSGGIVFQN